MKKGKIKDQQEKREGSAWRGILAAACVAVGMVVLIYFAGALFFDGHYYWKTRIDGKDYSFRSKEQVREEILNPAVSYELALIGREGLEDCMSPGQLGMVYVFDDTLDRLNEELDGFRWPQMLWIDRDWELPRTLVYDEEALDKRLRESVFFDRKNIRKPRNAGIGEYESGKGYSIWPDDPGTVLDFEKVKNAVMEALENLEETLDFREGGFYSEAEVKADDRRLNRLLDTANLYVGTRVEYRWNGETEVIDGDLISIWIDIGEDQVTLDEDAVREYINDLARKHDTYGRDRVFTTTAGNRVTLKSGSYGWWTNRAGETEALLASIREGEKVCREPLYYCRGYAEGGPGEDIGSSYVEIDLGNQHLYLYVEGKLILESDMVSGNIARGHGTPAGVFGITYKERDATLRGENYASHVDYWMPFNGNIGMHDASWRNSFGGEIYLTGGSHGCINLPRDAAAEIYGYVEANFPVVCYY